MTGSGSGDRSWNLDLEFNHSHCFMEVIDAVQRVELYNLKDDLSETNDLAGWMPELTATLRMKLARWRDSVGTQMAQPNPDYDSIRADQSPKQPAAKKKPGKVSP